VLTAGVSPTFAQVDFSGEWAPRFWEDQPERVPGPELGDYLGIPISDAARLRAESWDASIQTLPEWQCRPHGSAYISRGPSQLKIWKEVDPSSRETVAWHLEFEPRPHLGPERLVLVAEGLSRDDRPEDLGLDQLVVLVQVGDQRRLEEEALASHALAAGEQIIPADWTGLFALALCSQVIGQGLLVYALGHVPPLVVGVAMLTQPALSSLLGWLYYGEAFTPRDWTGAAMIVAALILVRMKERGAPRLHEPVAQPN